MVLSRQTTIIYMNNDLVMQEVLKMATEVKNGIATGTCNDQVHAPCEVLKLDIIYVLWKL